MHSIEGISNNKIKEIVKLHQKKYREETGYFITEGLKSVEELINSDIQIIEIYATKELNLNYKYTIISENTMKKLATTASVCEVLAIAKKRTISTKDFSNTKKLILLDTINDPGNLGTIIRSSSAFGIEGIILYGACVDLYSSKVIRSCAGNFLKIPIISIENTEKLKKIFPKHKLIATALSKENNLSLKECAELEEYIIMFGSEANGLCTDLEKIADKNIRLEMTNNVESLNLSVSASIILYELFTK